MVVLALILWPDAVWPEGKFSVFLSNFAPDFFPLFLYLGQEIKYIHLSSISMYSCFSIHFSFISSCVFSIPFYTFFYSTHLSMSMSVCVPICLSIYLLMPPFVFLSSHGVSSLLWPQTILPWCPRNSESCSVERTAVRVAQKVAKRGTRVSRSYGASGDPRARTCSSGVPPRTPGEGKH